MPAQPTTPRAPDVARRLLTALGYDDLPLDLPDRSPLDDWAESGLMHLTRDVDGTPLRPRGLPATVARGMAAALSAVARCRFDRTLGDGNGGPLDGAHLLAERAALASAGPRPSRPVDPHRPPHVSHGGRARFLRAADGWWVLHLARESDLELVPALVEGEADGPGLDEAWASVERWSVVRPAAEAVERAVLLGLPASRPGETPAPALPWSVLTSSPALPHEVGEVVARGGTPGGPRWSSGRVVNLGALWAGPLAAHLLGEAGFEVVHVESTGRPDASRWGDPGLHELLHRGAEQVQLDFSSPTGRAELRDLVSSADVVIEASRPRALEGLGIAPRDVFGDGRARTWLQVTGHGPAQPLRVGFGDDAAVAGGLMAETPDGRPGFSGDALADPLAGLTGALAVAALHQPDRTTQVAVPLAGVAAWCRSVGDVAWPPQLPEPRPPRHR